MHQYPTPHTWMHRNHHPSSECTEVLPLTHRCTANHHFSCECTDILPPTHECTKIIIPQVNAPESYPSHMNVSKSSPLRKKDRYLTPHTWMHRNHHPSCKCTRILTLALEWSEMVTPQVNRRYPTPHTWMHRDNHPSSKCTGILPLTHEYTEIVTPQVKSKSCPSNINAPKSSLLK